MRPHAPCADARLEPDLGDPRPPEWRRPPDRRRSSRSTPRPSAAPRPSDGAASPRTKLVLPIRRCAVSRVWVPSRTRSVSASSSASRSKKRSPSTQFPPAFLSVMVLFPTDSLQTILLGNSMRCQPSREPTSAGRLSMYAPQTRGTASLAAARMRSVAGSRVISFCNRDVRRMRLEDDFGRIRAESAGLTVHAVGVGARRKPRSRRSSGTRWFWCRSRRRQPPLDHMIARRRSDPLPGTFIEDPLAWRSRSSFGSW